MTTSSVPQLRFPEFEMTWNPVKGSQLFQRRTEKGEEGLPIYSVAMGQKRLVPRSSITKQMKGDAKPKDNFVACEGDIAYNTMRMWQGAMGIATEKCMVSPAYVVLSATKNCDVSFFTYALKRPEGLHSLWAHSYGLTDDRLRLYYKDFSQITFHAPQKKEQQKIANFLSTVDQKINLLKQKNDLLQQYKKGVTQQLFSQHLRFKDDKGSAFPDWKEKIVGDFMQESRIKGNTGDLAKKMTVKLWGRGVFEKRNKGGDSKNTQYYVRKSGQFIYSKLDFLNCAFGIIPDHLDGYETTVDLPCFDISDGINPYFILEYIKQKSFYKKYGDIANGSRKAKRINADVFLACPVHLPSPEEQQKIADFLQVLDKKIDLIQQQIDHTQAFKKGLLQQMFV